MIHLNKKYKNRVSLDINVIFIDCIDVKNYKNTIHTLSVLLFVS